MRLGSPRLARSARLSAAVGILASSVLLLFIPAGAQTSDESSHAELNDNGWWQKNAFPPNVPADAVAVSADGGDTSRVAAFGMDVFVGPDEVLSSLKLTLKETTQPGANYPQPPPEQVAGQQPAQSQVLIGACPITSIYTPEDGGVYPGTAPVADCESARGDGVRRADGSWEFDITTLAELWLSNAMENKGVLLVERVAAPMSFQVAFQDLSTGTPKLDLSTDFALEEEEPDSGTDDETFTEEIVTPPSEGDNFFTAIADTEVSTPTTPLGIVETPPTTAAPAAPEPEPAPRVVVNRKPTKGKLPLAMLLLVPAIMGVALVGGMVLGPAGDPATARNREGGLSRALARRDASLASE